MPIFPVMVLRFKKVDSQLAMMGVTWWCCNEMDFLLWKMSNPGTFHRNMSHAGTLLATDISPTKALLKMIFLFPRWEMLVSLRIVQSWQPKWNQRFTLPGISLIPEHFSNGFSCSQGGIWTCSLTGILKGIRHGHIESLRFQDVHIASDVENKPFL